MEIKMRKTVLTILGALLITGSAVQMATAAEHHMRRAPVAASQQFRDANNSIERRANTSCQNQEPGNPYNEQTDYQHFLGWEAGGGWDSRNDCW
jgi:hypothetical protein